MADERYAIELEIHSGSAEAEIARIDQEIQRVGNSSLNVKQKVDSIFKLRKQRAEAVLNLQALQKEFQKTGKAAHQAGGLRGIGFFGQQIGFLVSDARYGLLGMGNNLAMISTQFVQLQAQAKRTGKSLGKEFLKTLRGPTGILIAIQLLIVLLPEIIEKFKEWTSGTKKLATAIKELQKESDTLIEQIKEENEVLQKREKARRRAIFNAQDELKWLNRLSENTAEFLVRQGILADKNEILNLSRKEQLELLKELLRVNKEAEKLGKDIIEEKTTDRIAALLGLRTKSGQLIDKADIRIKTIAARTGKAYAEAAEIFWKSPEGRYLQAQIGKAQDDAYAAWLKEDWGLEEDRIAEIKAERLLNQDEMAIEKWAEKWTGSEAFKKHMELFADPFGRELLEDADYIEEDTGDDLEHPAIKQQITIGKMLLDLKEQQANAELALDDRVRANKMAFYDSLIQIAQGFAHKNKGLAIGILALQKGLAIGETLTQGAKSVGQIWANTAAANAKATAASPLTAGQPFVGINTAHAIKNTALTKKATAWSIATIGSTFLGQTAQVLNNSNIAGAGGAGGGSRSPNFNLIGATGDNQLREQIEQSNRNRRDQRVVLVTSELEVQNTDKRTTLEQTSFG